MSTNYPKTPIDPWSRFVSYCSLVVALGTLAWVLFGNAPQVQQATGLDLTGEQASTFEQEAAQRQQRDIEMREGWRQQQQQQLETYKLAADGMLAEHETLIEQLNRRTATYAKPDDALGQTQLPQEAPLPSGIPNTSAEEPPLESAASVAKNETAADSSEVDLEKMRKQLLAESEAIANATPNEPPAPNPDETADDSADETDVAADANALAFSPLLTQVQQTRKPTTDKLQGIVAIRNQHASKAIIDQIEFTPYDEANAIFAVSPSVALDYAEIEDTITIVFDEQDNRSAEAGKHGVYSRKLTQDNSVDGGQEIRIRMAIENTKHLGWGFRGQLKISYNGFRPLVIDNAELIFVDPTETVKK